MSLGVLTVVVLALIGWWLVSLLTGGNSDEPLNKQNLGLTTSAVAPEPSSEASPSAAPSATTTVRPVNAAVFSPQGTPDNAANAGMAIDGNPATVWNTDAYFQPFPALKNGVGLMVTLPDAAKLTSMQITSPTPGTQVEIRTAPSRTRRWTRRASSGTPP